MDCVCKGGNKAAGAAHVLLYANTSWYSFKTAHKRPFCLHAGSSGSSETSQVILYLRKQNEVLQTELQLAEQTAARLRSEAALARRAADQASAQLTSQMEQSRQSLRTESDHQASMAQQEQINLLRESNQALRWNPLLHDHLSFRRSASRTAKACLPAI